GWVGLFLWRFPFARALLKGGAFRPEDTRATADVLATLALGLFFFAVVRVVVPAFYALKETRMPVVAALIDCAVFVSGCFLLTPRLALPGIGLSSSIAAAVNVSILLLALRRREGRLMGSEIRRSLVRMVAAALVMGAAVWLALRFVDPTHMRALPAVGALVGLIAGGTAVYWLAAHWLGAPEPAELRRVAWRKRR